MSRFSLEIRTTLLKHLDYEFQMLKDAALYVGKYHPETASNDEHRILGNALIESFAVHARNLVEFFYHSAPKEDAKAGSARAEDYFRDPADWRQVRTVMPATLRDLDKKANWQISHLTYERGNLTDSQLTWEFAPIIRDLRALRLLFDEARIKDAPDCKQPGASHQVIESQVHSEAIARASMSARTVSGSAKFDLQKALSAKTQS